MSADFDFESLDRGPSVRARRRRPDGLTRALAVGLGLALAFSVGVRAGRASRPALVPAHPATASPAGGRPAPEPGVAVTGQVNLIDRHALYVTDAAGITVKVVVGPEAQVSAVQVASLADLHVGDTVVVRGERAADGAVSASSVIHDELK